MLNAVLYDIETETGEFSYAYKGLPLIFYHAKNEQTVISINPEAELDKILGKDSKNGFNSVSTIIKGAALIGDYIYSGIENNIFAIPFDRNEAIKQIKLVNEHGESIIYHFMKRVNDSLFFIDGYNSIIYKMDVPRVNS